MKTLTKKKTRLLVDTLRVDAFVPQEEPRFPQHPEMQLSRLSYCPSHPDSLCPCCTGPQLCPNG
jgi:hypothetical protein